MQVIFQKYMFVTVILQLANFSALLALFLSQIEETLKVAEALLGDLSGFRNLRRDATELAEELQTWRQEQFDEWARDMQEQIDDPNQQLRYLIFSLFWNFAWDRLASRMYAATARTSLMKLLKWFPPRYLLMAFMIEASALIKVSRLQ